MAEVPIPDGFDAGAISVAGTHDHDYGEADVNVDDRRHCRDITVPDGADSVGVSSHYADAVAAFLGTDADGDVSGSDSDATQASDGDEADDTATDGGTCEAVKNDGEVCGRDLPCPYHGET